MGFDIISSPHNASSLAKNILRLEEGEFPNVIKNVLLIIHLTRWANNVIATLNQRH